VRAAAPKKPSAAPALTSPAPISPARAAAFHILSRVSKSAAHSDDLLHSVTVNALSPEDRNLTTTLVLGVLRWQLYLDTLLRPLMQRPDADLHPSSLIALRLGLFQLLYLDRIPAHAALNESVELSRANGAPHAAGMVNAVLRRALREKTAEPQRKPLAIAQTPAEQAHPQWLITRWRANFGTAVTRRIADYDQAEPATPSLFIETDGMPTIDDGSRLVAELAAASIAAPKRILDCCAAPGGKTAVLALRHPSAEIVAADVNEKRLETLRSRLDRGGPATARVKTVLADLTKPMGGSRASLKAAAAASPSQKIIVVGAKPSDKKPEQTAASEPEMPLDPAIVGKFDLILCDAPCSGTGTLGRNPEIRHRLRESDLLRQADRQRAILTQALALLAPGGRLVYSTCSLEPEENEGIVQQVLAATPGIAKIPAETILSEVSSLALGEQSNLAATAIHEGTLRTLPGATPTDGFYAAVLERTL
jgi:16S rRNA (cytosine967-C5)-methyltransferase